MNKVITIPNIAGHNLKGKIGVFAPVKIVRTAIPNIVAELIHLKLSY